MMRLPHDMSVTGALPIVACLVVPIDVEANTVRSVNACVFVILATVYVAKQTNDNNRENKYSVELYCGETA